MLTLLVMVAIAIYFFNKNNNKFVYARTDGKTETRSTLDELKRRYQNNDIEDAEFKDFK
jgi:uncharacterized membrane protein